MRRLQTPSKEQQGVGVGCDEFEKKRGIGFGDKVGGGVGYLIHHYLY